MDDSDDEFDPVNVQPDNELEKVCVGAFVHRCASMSVTNVCICIFGYGWWWCYHQVCSAYTVCCTDRVVGYMFILLYVHVHMQKCNTHHTHTPHTHTPHTHTHTHTHTHHTPTHAHTHHTHTTHTPHTYTSAQAFSQYQDAKYVNTFVEDFGVEDEIVAQQEPFAPSFSRLMDLKCEVKADEQPSAASASFEVAWSMKIQQFDDSESDEEVWERNGHALLLLLLFLLWVCAIMLSCNICRSQILGPRKSPMSLPLTSRGIVGGGGEGGLGVWGCTSG